MSDPHSWGDVDAAMDSLYRALGRAVAEWAYVEDHLSGWFLILTGVSDALLASRIFFTPNSFKGRLDLLRTALESSNASEAQKKFAHAAMKKAEAYNEFRNALVHGRAAWHTDNRRAEAHIVSPGMARAPISIGVPQIDRAAINFHELASLMVNANFGQKIGLVTDDLLLSRYLPQVQLLPNSAGSSELSQNQKGQQRQQRAAQGIPIPTKSSGKDR